VLDAASKEHEMHALLQIGFVPVGNWYVESGNLLCDLVRHAEQANILYAFILDGEIAYVGKTTRPLAVRMAGYRKPAETQRTNQRNHKSIVDAISRGSTVDILALPDSGLMHYGQFHMNLAAALEDDIIRKLNPPWNGGRKEKLQETPGDEDSVAIDQDRANEAQSDVELAPKSDERKASRFTFEQQPTYRRTGFFNVNVAAQALLGGDRQTIEIFLGDAAEPVLGEINRRANTNGTPRVMGGVPVRDWFQRQTAVGGQVTVEVYSPVSIRLQVSAT
jgi:hypothetical protein